MSYTDRYAIFSHWMERNGFIREHKFHHEREWKMDYAHVPLAICLELDCSDIEKHNEATLAGWAVLRCTPQMIEDGTAYQLVERALKELDPFKR